MQRKSEKERINTVLSGINTKTQIAMEAIRKYQDERAYHYQIKNREALKQKYRIYEEMNATYTGLYFGKEILPNKSIKGQLFPHNEEYYVIDASDLLFPVRIFFRNVKNDGTVYIGYDLPFPGLNISKFCLKDKFLGLQKNYHNEARKYTFKFAIKEDIMILLHKQMLQKVDKIYVSLASNAQIFMFNLKFDHIGYPGMYQIRELSKQQKKSKSQQKRKRASTIRLQTQKRQKKSFILPPTHPTHRYHSKPRQSNNASQLNSPNEKISRRNSRTQPSQFIIEKFASIGNIKNPKNFILENAGLINMAKSKDRKIQKKEESAEKELRIKNKKKESDELKQKMLQLKIMAAEFKKDIANYNKMYQQTKVKNRKSATLLTHVLFITNFIKKTHLIYDKHQNDLSKKFMIRYLVKKFTKKLKIQYQRNLNTVPRFIDRNSFPMKHFILMNAKITHEESVNKSLSIIMLCTKQLTPGLIINNLFQKAKDYRRKVRIIQRRWLVKYKARMFMLQNYAQRQANIMVKYHKYLSVAMPIFECDENGHRLCYSYMREQSIKFRLIYDAYVKRLQQIDDFVKQNLVIMAYNKGKPEKKHRKYLQVPKKPHPPQHRFFRNLDILKSMLRGWFELEYKKIQKKNRV